MNSIRAGCRSFNSGAIAWQPKPRINKCQQKSTIKEQATTAKKAMHTVWSCPRYDIFATMISFAMTLQQTHHTVPNDSLPALINQSSRYSRSGTILGTGTRSQILMHGYYLDTSQLPLAYGAGRTQSHLSHSHGTLLNEIIRIQKLQHLQLFHLERKMSTVLWGA